MPTYGQEMNSHAVVLPPVSNDLPILRRRLQGLGADEVHQWLWVVQSRDWGVSHLRAFLVRDLHDSERVVVTACHDWALGGGCRSYPSPLANRL